MSVSLLTDMKDIPAIVNLAIELQNEKALQSNVPVQYDDFANWLYLCLESPSIEILYSRTENDIDGFLILSESVYPWNHSIKFGTDLMFLCRKNGIKLINLAKKIAKKRKWDSLILSTTCNDERVDKFMNHISKQKIGGVYDV